MTKAQKERRIAVRAGLFILLGAAIFGVVVMVMGRERRLFEPQVTYHASFENVDGLKKDSPVWLGGLEVGHVSAVTFAPDIGDKRIDVSIEISKRFEERVRTDSVARLASRGVLGDKAIDVSLGTATGSKVPPGGNLQTGTGGDIASLLKSSGEVMDNAIAISRGVRHAVDAYANPATTKDVSTLLGSASRIINAVETGKGPLHALIYDPKASDDMKQLLARASSTAAHVDRAIDQVDVILKDVRTGNGLAHAVLYDKGGATALASLGTAAGELAGLVRDAKESKNGAVHQLIYGDASGMFADLGAAAKDLKHITAQVAKGEGTLGALVNDPTVYDDLRTVLGNVKRNKILRALVRYSISNGQGGELEKVGQPLTRGPQAKKE